MKYSNKLTDEITDLTTLKLGDSVLLLTQEPFSKYTDKVTLVVCKKVNKKYVVFEDNVGITTEVTFGKTIKGNSSNFSWVGVFLKTKCNIEIINDINKKRTILNLMDFIVKSSVDEIDKALTTDIANAIEEPLKNIYGGIKKKEAV